MHKFSENVQNVSWISWRRRSLHSLLAFINKTLFCLFENRLVSPFCLYHGIASNSSVFVWAWEFMVANISDGYLGLNSKSFFFIDAHILVHDVG